MRSMTEGRVSDPISFDSAVASPWTGEVAAQRPEGVVP